MRSALPLALLVSISLLESPLQALNWSSHPGFRQAPLSVPPGNRVGFTSLSAASLGIDFQNSLSPERARLFQNLMNGSGVAAADVDGDGLVDLYFCHKQAPNQLYRNLGGGQFTNITVQAGVGCTNQTSVGAVFADVNGDGSQDLLVSAFGGPNALLLNNGQGRFTDVTVASGISGKSGATSLALGDVDSDGDLDLYLCNFAVQAVLRDGGVISTRMVNGQPQVTGRFANRLKIIDGILFEFGDPDTFLLNDGTGRFTQVTWEKAFLDREGKPHPAPWDLGLAVQLRDVNGDGFQDLYVCNDFQTPDRLWLGNGRGQFQETAQFSLRNMSLASMGVDFADLDRDGRYDFCTVEMLNRDLRQHLRTSSGRAPLQRHPGLGEEREEFPRNCLYWNRGDGTYAEIASFAGVAATGWSWVPLFLDVDLDGWEDLLVSNGHAHDVNDRDINERIKSRPNQNVQATKSVLSEYPRLDPPKFAFRNRRDLTFEDVSQSWGFNSTRIAHGMISADLDDDGDLDIVANAMEGPPLIYRNDSSQPRVAVRLKGRSPNTAGIGAEIRLLGGPVEQRQMILAGGQYLSHSQTQRTFAASPGDQTLEVRWASGRISRIPGVQANYLYEVDEAGATEPTAPPVPAAKKTWFTDVSSRLRHEHLENGFEDAVVQPLLPRRQSQWGPGTTWFDFNGDRHDDLIVGSGRGGLPSVYLGDGRGGFAAAPVAGPKLPDDLGAVVGWVGPSGRALIGAVANYETGGLASAPAALQWTWQPPEVVPGSPLPGGAASSGPLALGDVDGDGDLDLFVGARVTVRRWPEPGGSRFFRNEKGTWVPESTDPWKTVGPVSDALMADLVGDAKPELIVATELGPIRIFSRTAERWTERTQELGLASLLGWWNSVAVGDFDGDGQLDLLAGNLGRNSAAEIWGSGQARILFGEFDGTGTVGVVESAQQGGVLHPLRDRKLLTAALPDLPSRFPLHSAFATNDVRTLIGTPAKPVRELQTTTLESVLLQQRQGVFESHPLPREAQWAPAFGLAVADYDGDGFQDVVLAQNLFAVHAEDTRLDAGRGLLLRGDGRGGLEPIPGQDSGIRIYGEQRGAAAGDFDQDGRVDLVVSQNGAGTVLLHNERATPGLRVRLIGSPGNPEGVGAVLRPRRETGLGPAQTVTAGGGYWSQPSSVLVIGGNRPTEVEVRWPDGRTSRTAVPSTGIELEIRWSDGQP
ncbi:MAG: VCBS repeat-containing protein [Verrucomicrobia bacterium]|nr:VCBS repeat-containing protein [Verrucomicrobiota bacterium]